MLARFDGGAVAANVPDQFAAKMFLDQRLMHPLRQPSCGKLVEGTREGGFGRELLAQRETADAPQGTVDHQAFDQSPRRGHPKHGLGHKSVGQPRTFVRRTPLSTPRRMNEFFDAHPLQMVDHLLQFRRQRANVVAQFGQQVVLYHVPALHDQVASVSIHFAGFMMLASKPHHARNGRPHLPISPPAAK
jgi:hypothetical protein